MDILDDMLAGVGWTMQDYLKHGENDYYPPLPNGHRLFLHDIRRVAVRCAVAMGEEGDMVVSFLSLNLLPCARLMYKQGRSHTKWNIHSLSLSLAQNLFFFPSTLSFIHRFQLYTASSHFKSQNLLYRLNLCIQV